jgi:large subunit ribosomal protein L15
MEQHELRSPKGARRPRKRVGRGNASGQGTYAGKGLKGQQARAGSGPRVGFEGGQTPLIRRLPTRRGFRNPFRTEYAPVNLRDLARFPASAEVTPDALLQMGVVRTLHRPIKVLAVGELTEPLTVRAHRVSAAARAKIEAAGGTVEELTPRKAPEERRSRRRAARATKRGEAGASTAAETPAAEEQDDSDSETSES